MRLVTFCLLLFSLSTAAQLPDNSAGLVLAVKPKMYLNVENQTVSVTVTFYNPGTSSFRLRRSDFADGREVLITDLGGNVVANKIKNEARESTGAMFHIAPHQTIEEVVIAHVISQHQMQPGRMYIATAHLDYVGDDWTYFSSPPVKVSVEVEPAAR